MNDKKYQKEEFPPPDPAETKAGLVVIAVPGVPGVRSGFAAAVRRFANRESEKKSGYLAK